MSARASQYCGSGIYGAPFVKFTLTYDGSLPASANKPKNREKWEIRKAFDPQLRDLWQSHPALISVEENRRFPKSGGVLAQVHHLHPSELSGGPKTIALGACKEEIDLCAPIEKHGAWFLPLVRDNYALHCGLNVTFLRKEPPGKIYQGGDIDGRIKTLLDALTMPQHREQILENVNRELPIYCLMEDDSLVSGLHVESERLLTDAKCPADFVRLIIEVDVRVRQSTVYNQSFLG